jgi:hypothetical protein
MRTESERLGSANSGDEAEAQEMPETMDAARSIRAGAIIVIAAGCVVCCGMFARTYWSSLALWF